MTVQTSAGSTLRILKDAPATLTLAGYAAAFDAAAPAGGVLVGEITDLGEFGREYNPVTHSPLATRGIQKYKGSFDEGNMTIQLGLDDEDAGQLLCHEAKEDDADWYFEVTKQDGSRYFMPAKVMSFKVAVGSVDSITAGTINLAVTTTREGIGILGPLAP